MVAGVVVLRALFGRRIPLSLGTPVVAAVLLTILVVPGVWGAMRGLDLVRDDLRLAPGINEREKCLVDAHQDWAVNFSRWLTERMPPDSRFALSGSVPRVCLQLGLLPRLMVGFDVDAEVARACARSAGSRPRSGPSSATRSSQPSSRSAEAGCAASSDSCCSTAWR